MAASAAGVFPPWNFAKAASMSLSTAFALSLPLVFVGLAAREAVVVARVLLSVLLLVSASLLAVLGPLTGRPFAFDWDV